MAPIAAAPFEGNEAMAFRASAGQWFGLGILTDYRNMSAYANGSLKFHMRTTTDSTFKIGISTSFGDSWVDFVAGGLRVTGPERLQGIDYDLHDVGELAPAIAALAAPSKPVAARETYPTRERWYPIVQGQKTPSEE